MATHTLCLTETPVGNIAFLSAIAPIFLLSLFKKFYTKSLFVFLNLYCKIVSSCL